MKTKGTVMSITSDRFYLKEVKTGEFVTIFASPEDLQHALTIPGDSVIVEHDKQYRLIQITNKSLEKRNSIYGK